MHQRNFCRNNPLEGKTLLAIGDSLTARSESSVDGYPAYNFLSKIKDYFNLKEVINAGIGSTCIAEPTENNFIERYKKGEFDIQSVDIIYLWYGHNDQCRNVLLGEKGSTDTATWNGSLNYVCGELSEKFSGKVIFVTPLSVGEGKHPHPQNSTLRDFRDALIEKCIEYGFPCIDVYGLCQINKIKQDPKFGLTYDGIHMTQKGYDKLASLFIPQIELFCSEF